MYKSTLTTLALLGLASAQSTTELFLVGFKEQGVLGTVIGSDATATTYSLACADPSSEDCGFPPGFTFTQGASTVHYIYSVDSSPGSETIELSCQITDSVSGVCAGTVIEDLGSSSPFSSATTTPFSDGSSALGGMLVTITAGLGAATTTVVSTTATPTGSETSTKSSTSAAGKTTSTSTSASGTGSAATGSGSKTSSSTGAGAPMITRAPWVVGGAAAALAYAAM